MGVRLHDHNFPDMFRLCHVAERADHIGDAFGWDLNDVRWATINAMKSAFLPFDERLQIINRVIKPGFSMLGADG